MPGVVRPRGRLFWKYVVLFALLVSAALLTSGLVELYFSYRENLAALVALQREQAAGAAGRIEAFIRDIERQVGWASQGQLGTRQTVEQRRFEFIRLQRQAPAVTEVSQLDPAGREQLRVSRLAMDVVGSQADFSGEARFKEARPGRPYFGPVYFRKESEPYLTLSVAGGGDAGVTVAEVNLKFIWDVVSQIRIGTTGRAYVVDGRGQLVAHPDISLVLQKTDLSPPRAGPGGARGARRRRPSRREITVAKDSGGRQVLTASARISPLGWWVFVEQPLGEALAPLYASAYRTVGAPPRRRRAVRAGEPAAGPAHDDADPRARGRRRPDRRGRARPAHRRQDRRRARGARRSVQPDGRPAPRVLRHPRAEGGGTDRASSPRPSSSRRRRRRSCASSRARRRHPAGAGHGGRARGAALRRRRLRHPAGSRATSCASSPTTATIYAPKGDVMPARRPSGVARPAVGAQGPQPINREWMSGRAVVDRPHHPRRRSVGRDRRSTRWGRPTRGAYGHRAALGSPLMREGMPLGAIWCAAERCGPSPEKQVKLLETFAAQAVIAIENVRLFQELEARNTDLSESLEQQTATAEILRVISSSPTDVQPTFDADRLGRGAVVRGKRGHRLPVRREPDPHGRPLRRRPRARSRPSGGSSRAPRAGGPSRVEPS